ncbi:MAG: hypothetical protein JW895_08665 [Thermoleophilaceae bacterium]|nr:hypothetical protein [Thermoleophilaceae bacterium]
MNSRLFWKSLAVQAVAVLLLFGVLVALPLPDDFFEDFGFVVGPLAWLACSAVTARVLQLPLAVALFAAVAGGVAGAIVLVVASHWAGMVAALLVFGASCAGYDPAAEEAPTG